jgi:hypothetical protein
MRNLVVFIAALALCATGVGSAQAASTDPHVGHSAAAPVGVVTRANAIKAALDKSPHLTRTVTSAGGIRTYTYRSSRGISFSTTLPAGAAATPTTLVRPNISLGGCGFLQNCLYFNHTDQKAILYGGGAGIGAAICIVGTPAACVVAAIIIGVALVYLDHHGICGNSRKLRVRWFPTVGGATCVS